MSLREKEKLINRDLDDGIKAQVENKATLNDLFQLYISGKTKLKASTKTNYIYMYEKYVTGLTKTNGTKSCGCLRRKPSPTCIDLTGQVFGMLTVLHKDHTSEVGKAKWVCRCECGQLVSVLSESLRNGSTKSCGCLVRRLTHDLTGKEFGHLLVLERTYDRRYVSKDTRWKCLCQNCGRTVSVSSRQLRTGNPYGHCKCTRYKK